MKLSVIIARDNYHDFVPSQMVEAIKNQTLNKEIFEVIIPLSEINDLYEPIAYEMEKSAINTNYFYTANNSRSKMTNAAISKAKGEVILFLAEDFVPKKDLFSIHYNAHQLNRERVTAYGPCFFPKEITKESNFAQWLDQSGELFGVNFTDKFLTTDFYFYFGNSSVKKELLAEIGPINEKLPFPCVDDLEFGDRIRRAGINSIYLPEAEAIHDHPLDEKERYESMYRAGISMGTLNNNLNGLILILKASSKLVFRLVNKIVPNKEYEWLYQIQLHFCKGLFHYFFKKLFSEGKLVLS